MTLSAKLVFELNKTYKFIDNAADEMFDLGGTSVGLRAGSVYKLVGEGKLSPKERRYPIAQKEVDIASNDIKIVLDPGEYRIFKSMETLNLPVKRIPIGDGRESLLVADIRPIIALQDCGIIFVGGRFQPGHSGKLTLGLYNTTKSVLQVDLGARIANMSFEAIYGQVEESAVGTGQDETTHQLEGSSF